VWLAAAAAMLGAATPTARGAGGAAAAAGERLFYGEQRFARGGPACAACHPVAGLPPPGGGTMGPDLTDAHQRFGPAALDTMLATLFFPTMDPLFAGRLLTPGERSDLEAFLAAAGDRRPPQGATGWLLLASALLFVALAAALAWLGRTRLTGVRAALVRRARPSPGARP
jgi:hypothetical protein